MRSLLALLTLAVVLAALGLAGLIWSEVHARSEATKAERMMAQEELLHAAIAVVDAEAHRRALGGLADDAPKKHEAQAALDRALVEARQVQVFLRTSGVLTPPSDDADFVEELSNTLWKALEAQGQWMSARERNAGEAELERLEELRDQEYENLNSALGALRSREPETPSWTSMVWTVLERFALRASNLAAPGLLIVAAALALGTVIVRFVPWARQQVEAILSTLVNPSKPDAPGSPRLKAASAASQGISALGSLGARVVFGTTAAAVTVGALALAIPGESIQLALQRPETSETGVRVGEFGIDIDGERISLKPGRRSQSRVVSRVGRFIVDIPGRRFPLDVQETELPPVGVDIGRFDVSLPGKRIVVPPENVQVSYGGANIEVPEVTVRPPDVRVVLDPAGMPELMEALGELTEKVSVLEMRLAEATAQSAQVRTASVRLLDEAQEAINSTNRRPANALFAQARINRNCSRFCDLYEAFPDELQEECAKPRRFEPFFPWINQHTEDCVADSRPVTLSQAHGFMAEAPAETVGLFRGPE